MPAKLGSTASPVNTTKRLGQRLRTRIRVVCLLEIFFLDHYSSQDMFFTGINKKTAVLFTAVLVILLFRELFHFFKLGILHVIAPTL